MKTFREIKVQIEQLKPELHGLYGVSRVELFGSFVRVDQGEDSDLDVLVDFDRPVFLMDVAGLEIFLREHLQINVDVVLRRCVRPELRNVILDEAVAVLNGR